MPLGTTALDLVQGITECPAPGLGAEFYIQEDFMGSGLPIENLVYRFNSVWGTSRILNCLGSGILLIVPVIMNGYQHQLHIILYGNIYIYIFSISILLGGSSQLVSGLVHVLDMAACHTWNGS